MKSDLFHPSRWVSSINFQWNTIKYTDFNGYFSFSYPNEWTIWVPVEDFDALISVDVDQELMWPHLWIIRKYVEWGVDNDSLLLEFSKNLKNNWFSLENLEEIKTDALDWIKMTLKNTIEDKKYKMVVIISVVEQKEIYLLSYVASEENFEDNIEWYDKIVESFKLLK